MKYEAGVRAALSSPPLPPSPLRQASPDVDEEGFSLQPADEAHNILSRFSAWKKVHRGRVRVDDGVLDARSPASRGKEFFSSSDSEDDEDSRKKFKIRIKPLVSDSGKCVPPSMDELKASAGGLALSPSLVSAADHCPHLHLCTFLSHASSLFVLSSLLSPHSLHHLVAAESGKPLTPH